MGWIFTQVKWDAYLFDCSMYCPLADFASYWGVQGPVSEHLMSFDWGQNLGRCFGGILNVSAQAWRCVFWSMPVTYLLEVTRVPCCKLESGQIYSMQIWLRSVNEINHLGKAQRWCLSQLWLKNASIMKIKCFKISLHLQQKIGQVAQNTSDTVIYKEIKRLRLRLNFCRNNLSCMECDF